MLNTTCNRIKHQIQHFKSSFSQTENLPFKNAIPNQTLEKLAQTSGNYRDKIFLPLITLRLFITQVLSTDNSCKNAVAQFLASQPEIGLYRESVNTGAYCKARQRLPLQSIINSAREVGNSLHRAEKTDWLWNGFSVVLIDGTTLQMPDTKENQSQFPQSKSQKQGLGFPIARMTALTSLACGSIIDYAMSACAGKNTGELSLLSQMFESLSKNDLIVADRYYCTYGLICIMLEKKIPVVFQNHANKKCDFRLGEKLGPKDNIVEWVKPKRTPAWMTQEEYAKLPGKIKVRQVQVNKMVIITTLLDAKKYRKKSIAQLYGERWKIELDLRSIKDTLQMGTLRCKSPNMIKKEVACHMLGYNLIRLTLAQSAKLNNIKPRQLSFKNALQLSNAFQYKLLLGHEIKESTLTLMKAIASTRVGLRKRSTEPRAVKRRPKPYPLLKQPRQEAREQLLKSK